MPAPLVMRARLIELEPLWLEVQCGTCRGCTIIPLKLLVRQRGPHHQLGAILVRLKCKRCACPPAAVWLNETPNRERNYGAPPGWSVQLIPD